MNRWKFVGIFGSFYEWKYRGDRLVYDSSLNVEGFSVEAQDYDPIKNIGLKIYCHFWHNRILRFFILAKIRTMAKKQFFKEIPGIREGLIFSKHLEATYPKTYRMFNDWWEVQSCIYKKYGYLSIWLEDFFALANSPFDKSNFCPEAIEKAHSLAEDTGIFVPAKIREEDIHLAKSCPDQYSKEALETIDLVV